jgi:hypothetical protein
MVKGPTLINNGKHQTKEGIQTSLEAIQSMNTQRSSWDWKHLTTFYSKKPHFVVGRYYGYAVSVW